MKAGAGTRGCAALVAVMAALFAGCGNGDSVSYSNKQIVKKLNLDKSGNGYTIDGDIFCEVEAKLLNDSDEVESAAKRDDLGLVISSREGNVGVKGVPAFPRDCGEKAKKKLNKLDPKPKKDS